MSKNGYVKTDQKDGSKGGCLPLVNTFVVCKFLPSNEESNLFIARVELL